MDQEEEKKDALSDVNPAILEAFDGDLDEWLEWNRQAEEYKEQVVSESEEDDGIERQLTADGKAVEWFNIRAEESLSDDMEEEPVPAYSQMTSSEPVNEYGNAAMQSQTVDRKPDQAGLDEYPEKGAQMVSEIRAETTKLIREDSYQPYHGQPGVLSKEDQGAKIHPIDVTDPHYVNYVPDPYYEYGIGPEPKRPRGRVGGPSGMSIASMCCGIGSLVLIFCGYGIPLSIVALVLGIISLNRKPNTTGGKTMSIIGISLASVSMLGMLVWLVYVIMDM